MNDSLKPIRLTINNLLKDISLRLKATGIDSARLDSELIIAHHLKVDRTYLHAHPDKIISVQELKKIEKSVKERQEHKPIAYITGHKEFYGRSFKVNRHTLIPRPESEMIIELLGSILDNDNTDKLKLIDIGTGSGCLGISAKLEFPELDVTLSDISSKALKMAEINAKQLGVKVNFKKSDLLSSIRFKPNIILANLPYVDKAWDISPDTKHEPPLALFAKDNGLAVIKELIKQINNKTSESCYILIEADPKQHQIIERIASQNQLSLYSKKNYILVFTKKQLK